jgi:hypothetical protein
MRKRSLLDREIIEFLEYELPLDSDANLDSSDEQGIYDENIVIL